MAPAVSGAHHTTHDLSRFDEVLYTLRLMHLSVHRSSRLGLVLGMLGGPEKSQPLTLISRTHKNRERATIRFPQRCG